MEKSILLLCGIALFAGCSLIPIDDPETIIKAGLKENCLYTNPVPDPYLPSPDYPGYEDENYPIDLNEDGVDDFKLRYASYFGNQGRGHSFWVSSLHQDCQIATDQGLALIYDVDVSIQCSEQFTTESLYLYDYDYVPDYATGTGKEEITEKGNWKNMDRRCIAFRLLIDGAWHLGWIKIGLTRDNTRLVIYEYAYSKNPGC